MAPDFAAESGGCALPRFLHSGDWQLGMKRRYLSEDAQARLDEARFEAIRRLGAVAREADCELVVVCGDVFESNAVDRRTVARALEALAEVRLPVFLLPGNHDPLDGASVYRSAAFRERAPSNVRVLEDARPVVVRPGLELVGAPWYSKRPDCDLVASACAGLSPSRSVTRIAVAHGAVDALSPDRDDPARIALDVAEAALREGRIHYLALGDRHSRTEVGASGRIHYAGAPEPTDWTEVDPGHVLVVDASPDAVHVTPHRVSCWRFVRHAARLDGDADLDSLERWLEAAEDKPRCILRLTLEGALDLRGAARLDSILEHARHLFACVDVPEAGRAVAVLPDDADFEELGLSGFAARAVRRLRSEADAGEPAARDALGLLVRLASGGEGAA